MDFLYLVKLTHSIIIILHLFLLEIYKNLFALFFQWIYYVHSQRFVLCRTLIFKNKPCLFHTGCWCSSPIRPLPVTSCYIEKLVSTAKYINKYIYILRDILR